LTDIDGEVVKQKIRGRERIFAFYSIRARDVFASNSRSIVFVRGGFRSRIQMREDRRGEDEQREGFCK
ncbi:hypothetical protein U1Q18_012661, partial [Sarracenia purpurea var. burkii]